MNPRHNTRKKTWSRQRMPFADNLCISMPKIYWVAALTLAKNMVCSTYTTTPGPTTGTGELLYRIHQLWQWWHARHKQFDWIWMDFRWLLATIPLWLSGWKQAKLWSWATEFLFASCTHLVFISFCSVINVYPRKPYSIFIDGEWQAQFHCVISGHRGQILGEKKRPWKLGKDDCHCVCQFMRHLM